MRGYQIPQSEWYTTQQLPFITDLNDFIRIAMAFIPFESLHHFNETKWLNDITTAKPKLSVH